MPSLPFARMVKSVEVAVPAVVEATVKSGRFGAVTAEFEMERSGKGEVEPIPKLPFWARKIEEVAVSVVPLEA